MALTPGEDEGEIPFVQYLLGPGRSAFTSLYINVRSYFLEYPAKDFVSQADKDGVYGHIGVQEDFMEDYLRCF